MPELHSLTTFVYVDATGFGPVLGRFAGLLRELGVWNPELRRAFADFPAASADESIYSTVTGLDYYASPLSPLALRPNILVWTPAIVPELSGVGLELGFLFETTALTVVEHERYHYRPGVGVAVQALARHLHAAFPGAGIYLADELQDGAHPLAPHDIDPVQLWQFDYALLPPAVAAQHPAPPPTHELRPGPSYTEAWYAARWR